MTDRLRRAATFCLTTLCLLATAAPAPAADLSEAVGRLLAAVPGSPDVLSESAVRRVAAAARVVLAEADDAAANLETPERHFRVIGELAAAKRRIDEALAGLLELRGPIAMLPAEQRAPVARQFLGAAAELIDLSGRLNYRLRDLTVYACMRSARDNGLREQFVDRLTDAGCTVGATLAAALLIDPTGEARRHVTPSSRRVKVKVLTLLTQHGRPECLPRLVEFLKQKPPADLALYAAGAATRIGLSQSLPPGAEAVEDMQPVVTAAELRGQVAAIDPDDLSGPLRDYREQLASWIERRAEEGVGAGGYAAGRCAIRPGDWILYRNPSPYNRFADLNPGLFTHVGIVTTQVGPDGRERTVLVDLNERQTRINGANVEATLPTALYYAVLRHDDPEAAARMAEVARSLIGNEAEFDLTFESSRVTSLRGSAWDERKVKTYCVGVLMICAQETGRPLREFFPIPETVAGGATAENLSRIGLRIGADFSSPTGALFARGMRIVHVSEPMYDPAGEVEQTVYDHFAGRLAAERLEPRQTLYQSLRTQVADMAKSRPLLTEVVAAAAGVHPDTDLAAAARAAAVVETLDAVAQTCSQDFRIAYDAVLRGPGEPPGDEADAAARAAFAKRQEAFQRHADLADALRERRLTPAELERRLIRDYSQRGRRRLDRLFFPESVDERSPE